MTRARPAERAGMSQAAISRLEHGRCLPTLPLLERVAGAPDSVPLVAIEPGRRVAVHFRACVPGAVEAVERTRLSRTGDAVAVVD